MLLNGPGPVLHPFISVDLSLVYHKVKAHGQDPKQQWPIISQGNWLLIGNNNRSDWGWGEKYRQMEGKSRRETEGSIKNDWSMSHSRLDSNRNREGPQFTYFPTGTDRLLSLLPSSFFPFFPEIWFLSFLFCNYFCLFPPVFPLAMFLFLSLCPYYPSIA